MWLFGGHAVLGKSGNSLLVLSKYDHTLAVVKVEPDGARAFVACGPDNFVAVLDLRTLKLIGHIGAGGEPDGMAWATNR